jgi:hypothetical protein
MSSNDNSYNIYNKFDPNFVNYGELYKSPREMKQNSKMLIDLYADALVKGSSPVYTNTPNLVGNRYFINTNSQCLDKNDRTKTHPRSVLVDNVNKSAMETTKDGNTGLIYSLLASLKTINGEEMFKDVSNNEPTEYINNGTDYLKDLSNAPIPLCSKVTVFADDKKDKDVSGWLTDSDRQDIDPKAIKEGFISVADSMGSGMPPGEWAENAKKTSDDMQDQADAVSEEAQSSANSTMSSANSAKSNGENQANSIKGNSSKTTKDQITTQSKSANDAFNKAKKAGAGMTLKDTAQDYLKKHSKENILFFIKNAINTRYTCSGDIQKYTEKKVVKITNEQQKLYDKYRIWLEMKIAKNIIREKMIQDNLDPTVVLGKTKEEKVEQLKKNKDGSRQVRIPAKCIYSIFEKNPVGDVNSLDARRADICDPKIGKISVKNVFNAISNNINKNKTNNKELNVPEIPSSKVCIWSNETIGIFGGLGIGRRKKVRKDVDSHDYKKMLELLDRYRLDFAIEIIRYGDVGLYGNCDAIGNEGFTTIDKNDNLTPYKSYRAVDFGAYLFIIFMIFLIFFVVYKCMFRAFNFKSVLKNIKIGKK